MSLRYFLKYATCDTSMTKAAISLLLYVVSIQLSMKVSQPESHYRVLSTLQNIFISHQIYSSLITKSGNAHLLDQIPLYVLPSSLVIQRSHALLRIRSSAPVSCFVVSSCNIINLLSLISTYYRAETLPPWVFFCLSHHAADRFVLSTFLRLSPNCKHPSFFRRFWLICTKPQVLLQSDLDWCVIGTLFVTLTRHWLCLRCRSGDGDAVSSSLHYYPGSEYHLSSFFRVIYIVS